MRYVSAQSPGGPEVLEIKEGPKPELGDGEILIEVVAAGVNRPDLAQRAGTYPPPPGASPVMGLEVAGVIAAVGPNAKLRVGDKVCALTPGGGYAEFCKVHESNALPIPQGFTMEEAAGICETYFTVWANVFQIGGLKAKERILIHGGASGIGTTAIQLARAMGAEVFVTAGTEAKCKACLDLGAHFAINYKTQEFEKEIARLTGGEGVDVILDMVGGDYAQRNIDSLARKGRLVVIAVQRGVEGKVNLAKIMMKRLTVTGSTMRPRTVEEKAQIARELRETVWPLLEARKVKVVIDRVFPLDEVRSAHEYLEKGDHFGKVVLLVKPS